jgi:predicted transcriptional regulator
MTEEEFMAFLQKNPHLYELIRNRELFRIVKILQYGGKTARELAILYNLDENKLKESLDALVALGAIGKTKSGETETYYLNFDGKKLIELHKKTKKEFD